jgi:hypothetical protein
LIYCEGEKETHATDGGPCSIEIDGAYFGTTFPHAFLLAHSHLVPSPPTQVYVPKIYGFKVHPTSEYYTGSTTTKADRSSHRRGRTRVDRMLRS